MSGDIWYAIPCANYAKARETLPKWKRMGYRVAVLFDQCRPLPADLRAIVDVAVSPWPEYRGYVASVNHLMREVLPDAEIIGTGGDDISPDPRLNAVHVRGMFRGRFPDLFGVMQPIGDTLDGTDRICGSPFIGRTFIDEVNEGTGPYWHEYFAFYSDEELLNVSRKLGALDQNPYLTHYHDHWTRRGEQRPAYLEASHAKWDDDKALFYRRKAAGFPGSARKAAVPA